MTNRSLPLIRPPLIRPPLIRLLLIRAALVVAVIVPALAVNALTAGSAEARQCSNARVKAAARGPTKGSVMRIARLSWSRKVERAMGPAWKVWNISAARRTVCRLIGVPQGSTHPYRWICYRSARPCLLAVE